MPISRRSFLRDSLIAASTGPLLLRAEEIQARPKWSYLENEHLKLGIRPDMGAGVGWLSASGSDQNLLDHYDHGRLVQQSWYGKVDGSTWGDKPWRWNPVQGGDYKGHGAKVLSLTEGKTELRATIRPRNWAGGQLLDDCEMEQHIKLVGRVAVLDFTFRYSGKETHLKTHHEVPAAFFHPSLTTMVIHDGKDFQRSQPGWPNESREIPEGWAAWINERGTGAGVFTPMAKSLTCYRFGTSPTAPSACSYCAPLILLAITPGLVLEYSVALAVGTPEEMRQEFARVRPQLKVPTLPAQ